MEYHNPYPSFQSGAPFLDEGRRILLQRISEYSCQQPPNNLDIHGLPEIGKSTLLRYVAGPHYLEGHGREWLTGEFRAEPHRLFRFYVSGWVPSTHPFIRLSEVFYRAYDEYAHQMAQNQPGFPLPPLSPPSPAEMRSADEVLARLEHDIQVLNRHRIRPVMLIDDFDQAFGQLDIHQTARFGNWKEYCALFFATERRLEDVNAAAKGSPLFKRLPQFRYNALLPAEAETFLNRPLQDTNVTFPAADVALVIQLAGGFPFLLLQAGEVLWEIRRHQTLLAEGNKPLPSGTRQLLTARLAQTFQRSFELYYYYLSSEQREALHEVARADTLNLSAIKAQLHIQLSGLQAFGLVNFLPGGTVRLFSPLLSDFVKAQETPARLPGPSAGLTTSQQDLYTYFRRRPGQLLTFRQLGRDLWTGDEAWQPTEQDKRKIHIAVSRLRKHLGEGEQIVSVRRQGYRYDAVG